jgi:hypothetical protein
MPINTESVAYRKALPGWDRIEDCMEGQAAMVAARGKYLRTVGEQEKDFTDYLKSAFFYGGLRRTVQGLRGAITQKDPVVKTPPLLKPLLDDMVPQGRVPLSVLIQRVLDPLLSVGRIGLLVDMPENPQPGNRPYVTLRDARDIMDWRTAVVGNDEILTRVVLRESLILDNPADMDGPGIEVEQYRKLELRGTPGSGKETYWQSVYRLKPRGDEEKPEGNAWVLVDEVQPTRGGVPLTRIPFIVLGPQGIQYDVADPPMLDLANANIAHWQLSADYGHTMHLCSSPTAFIEGPLATEVQGSTQGMRPQVQFGAGVCLRLMAGAHVGYASPNPAVLTEVRQALGEKKQEMAILGARLLEEPPNTQETATSANLRHSGEQANLASIAKAASTGIEEVLRWIGWWMGTEETSGDVQDVEIKLNTDFTAAQMSVQDATQLMTMWQSGAISYPTFYAALEAGGMTRANVNWQQELAAIAAGGGPPQPLTDDVDEAVGPGDVEVGETDNAESGASGSSTQDDGARPKVGSMEGAIADEATAAGVRDAMRFGEVKGGKIIKGLMGQ